MNGKINIVYIDDRIDDILSSHMITWSSTPLHYKDIEIRKNYEEVEFDKDKGYRELINNEIIKAANIILIDNHLFEERSARSRFSGQQFKVLIKKLLPYIEVIIITQDAELDIENSILKFSDTDSSNAESYYKKNLDPYLDKAIKEVMTLEEIAQNMASSSDVDKFLQDSILISMKGDVLYDGLEKSDIDNLIYMFQEIKNAYNHQ